MCVECTKVFDTYLLRILRNFGEIVRVDFKRKFDVIPQGAHSKGKTDIKRVIARGRRFACAFYFASAFVARRTRSTRVREQIEQNIARIGHWDAEVPKLGRNGVTSHL